MLEQIVEQCGMVELLDRYRAAPDVLIWGLCRNLLEMLMEPPVREKLPQFNTLQDAVQLIQNAQRIIVLTGAGISVSCGIPDFRSENGIYARLGEYHLPNPQCMFDLAFFKGNPRPFFHFAKELLPGNFVPSPSHFFIGALHRHGKLLRNFTQNIDGLEKLAGVDDVALHQCHGHFDTITCTHAACGHKGVLKDIRDKIEAQEVPVCPVCKEAGREPPGILKPDIVFFGENLGDTFRTLINSDKGEADLVLVMGSSLAVGPVNMIPQWVGDEVPQILINREPVGKRIAEWDIELLGDCDAIVAELCRRLGWEIPAPGSAVAAAVTEEQPFEFIEPNRYLFKDAKLEPFVGPNDYDDSGGDTEADHEDAPGEEDAPVGKEDGSIGEEDARLEEDAF